MNESTELQVVKPGGALVPDSHQNISTFDLLQGALKAGVTKENVEVVKELLAMRREEFAHDNKIKFNQSFFKLRKEIQTMNFYADKAATTDSGKVAYRYCSETEMSENLEPVLLRHGFSMMFGQKQEGERTAAVITLIHEDGHEETREFWVRSGNVNKMKDATAADTGATTSAWRHLCTKWFGLKSRIQDQDDPRKLGDVNTKVTADQADELERRVKMLNGNVASFLKLGGAATFAEIPAGAYPVLDQFLQQKEGRK